MNQDQAEKLRELVENDRKCKTILFMNGKEKVGQTMAITNLATLLSENNYKTLILDGGDGFVRTDTLLKVMPKYGIRNFINNGESIESLMVPVNDNFKVIYARTLLEDMQTSTDVVNKSIEYLENFKEDFDFILVDLENINIIHIKDIIGYDTEVLFTLTTDDLGCLKKTYAIIKEIGSYTDIKKVNIIINKVVDKELADDFYERLKIASNNFLGIKVESLGYISKDIKVIESLKEQTPITKLCEDSKVSKEFKEIFSQIISNQ